MAVIGSVLVDREMHSAIGEIVAPGDFYAHVHETIFAVLIDLYDRGEPVDKITVGEELRRRNLLESVGGLSYISALMDTVQSAGSARYYATHRARKGRVASLIHAGSEITQLGYEGEEDVDGALDRSRATRVCDRRTPRRQRVHQVNRLMKDAFDHIDRLVPSTRRSNRLDHPDFAISTDDDRVSAGQLHHHRRAPGMGKTSFALNMAVAAAREAELAGCVLLAGNVEQRIDSALDLFRGAHLDERYAARQHQTAPMGRYVACDGRAQRTSDLSRRRRCANRRRRA